VKGAIPIHSMLDSYSKQECQPIWDWHYRMLKVKLSLQLVTWRTSKCEESKEDKLMNS